MSTQLPLGRYVDPLRVLAARLGLSPLAVVAREPGVVEAFRVTVVYHDARHPDQVATLVKMQAVGPAQLKVHYRRPNDKPLIFEYALTVERFRAFSAALRRLDFDQQDDSPDAPTHGADLWLVERACGPFHHDLMLAPAHLNGRYAQIVALIYEYIRESVRAIN